MLPSSAWAAAQAAGPPFSSVPEEQAGDEILAEDIQEHVDILSSDLFEGRGAGTRGERRAAGYIVSVLEEIEGLEPAGDDGTWFQEFPVPAKMVMDEVEFEVGRNVLAMLPGSDPELASEVIVMGAHYDHVGPRGLHGGSLGGIGEIHNGADDNASGSSLLLEVAAALATSERPRRSVMFQWYSAEELGLVGSKHWVAHPTVELERVMAMLNFDMVGRLTGSTLLVGGTGSSPELESMIEASRGFQGLDYVIDPPGNAPSDNSSFYEAGIPVLFLFTGVHADYHRATDDADKLNALGVERIARLGRLLIRQLDEREASLTFRDAPGMANYWVPSVEYGFSFDPLGPESEGQGVAELVVLTPDSPAGRSRDHEGRGLREGDVLMRVDGEIPGDFATFQESLRITDDERSARTFEFLRDGGELLRFTIQPEVR
ncbi:MAG: M28 family peptidase [Planctomycetota bacterium]|nr:M28 family peptidase [Planctomycetota bacterium]